MNIVREVAFNLKQWAKLVVYSFGILTKHRKTAKLRWRAGRVVVQMSANRMELFGHPMDNGVARPIYTGKEYEPDETRFLVKNLSPGSIFLDIGANIGYFTTLAARLVGPTGKVIAIEPDPTNYSLLRLNVEHNQLSNVIALNCAAGPAEGRAALYRSTWNFGDHRMAKSGGNDRHSTEVKVETIDQIIGRAGVPHVDLVKIDVQGFEQQVQAGMTTLLESDSPPTVITELWPYGMESAGGNAEQYYNGYASRGFFACKLQDNGGEQRLTWPEIVATLPRFDARFPDSAYLNLVFRKQRDAAEQ